MAVATELFSQGDVYIDFPQENCMFRYDRAAKRLYRWFNDDDSEDEVEQGSELFAESRMYGSVTTRERYYGRARPA